MDETVYVLIPFTNNRELEKKMRHRFIGCC